MNEWWKADGHDKSLTFLMYAVVRPIGCGPNEGLPFAACISSNDCSSNWRWVLLHYERKACVVAAATISTYTFGHSWRMLANDSLSVWVVIRKLALYGTRTSGTASFLKQIEATCQEIWPVVRVSLLESFNNFSACLWCCVVFEMTFCDQCSSSWVRISDSESKRQSRVPKLST